MHFAALFAIVCATGRAQGQIAITEFMASNQTTLTDADGDTPDWIEIVNYGATSVNLAGWHLTDTDADLAKWTFPPRSIAPAGILIVFASSKNLTPASGDLHTNFKLSAGGEYLALVEPDGKTVVTQFTPEYPPQFTDVSYGFLLDSATGAPMTDTPLYFTLPSPGQPNDAGAASLGPLIADVQFPTAPAPAGLTIPVTARVTAALDPVGSVELNYQRMFFPESTVAMFDDGAHGDGAAGDGLYGGSVPTNTVQAGEMIRFAVEAVDTMARQSRWPLFEDRQGFPSRLGTIVETDAEMSPLPVLHWFVQDFDAATSRTGTQASVYFDGEFYDNIFVRLRGGTTMELKKKSFKFEFNRGQKFQYSSVQERVDEFDLNTTFTDKAYIRQPLSFEVFRDAGVPASIAFPMRVERNGGFYSVDLFLEQPDETYLARNGLDDDGAFYKMLNPLDSVIGAEKKTRRDEGDDGLQALIDGLMLTGEALETFLFDNVDLPATITYLAVTTLIGDADSFRKDYYLYQDTDGIAEWSMLPWDKDLTFGRLYNDATLLCDDTMVGDLDPYWGQQNRMIGAIFANLQTREMFARRLRTLMDTLLQPIETPPAQRRFENRLDEFFALMEADVALDYLRYGNPWTCGADQQFAEAIAILKTDYLNARRQFLFVDQVAAGAIPEMQPERPVIHFGHVEFDPASGDQNEEYIELVNKNLFAVDVTGWRLAGAVDHVFAPGVVIPGLSNVFVSPDVNAFRARAQSPRGAEGRFVRGEYSGRLANGGETIFLFDDQSSMVAEIAFPTDSAAMARWVEAE